MPIIGKIPHFKKHWNTRKFVDRTATATVSGS